MEETQSPPPCEDEIVENQYGIVDNSRPFRSVKEAIAIFGDRILAGDIYSQKPHTITKHEAARKSGDRILAGDIYFQKPHTITKHEAARKSPPRQSLSSKPSLLSSTTDQKQPKYDELALVNTLKKLQTELEETKLELRLLKERGSETEVALASLNAELHKNMSKMAEAEAAAAAKAVVSRALVVQSGRYEGYEGDRITEEDITRNSILGIKKSQSLARALNLDHGKEDYFGDKKKQKIMKKKPIIPLVGDLFFKKKSSSSATLHNTLYSSPQVRYSFNNPAM